MPDVYSNLSFEHIFLVHSKQYQQEAMNQCLLITSLNSYEWQSWQRGRFVIYVFG